MLALNIFRLIGDLFTNVLFVPYDYIRLVLAKADAGWWISNGVNFVFILILIGLLGYWIGQAIKFKREGVEDHA